MGGAGQGEANTPVKRRSALTGSVTHRTCTLATLNSSFEGKICRA